MSFFDTVKGQLLADALIDYLPLLAVEEEQKVEWVNDFSVVVEVIQTELMAGWKVVSALAGTNDEYIVVFARRKE